MEYSTSPAATGSTADKLIDRCLGGEILYGDDLGPEAIEAWYRDEAEAYAGLHEDGPRRGPEQLLLHELVFKHLPDKQFTHVLGLGSAEGMEFEQIVDRTQRITVLEPSETFVRDSIGGVPATYIKPRSSGVFPFPDATFDLATSFAVLHHIPNVSFVLTELFRCLAPGAFLLLHEPSVSLGDWRGPRNGLTKHERGIPPAILKKAILSAGFEVLHQKHFDFPITNRALGRCGNVVWLKRIVVGLDFSISAALAGRASYHAVNPWQKLRPRGISFVLRRPVSSGGRPPARP